MSDQCHLLGDSLGWSDHGFEGQRSDLDDSARFLRHQEFAWHLMSNG
jgi:hypothetical protein